MRNPNSDKSQHNTMSLNLKYFNSSVRTCGATSRYFLLETLDIVTMKWNKASIRLRPLTLERVMLSNLVVERSLRHHHTQIHTPVSIVSSCHSFKYTGAFFMKQFHFWGGRMRRQKPLFSYNGTEVIKAETWWWLESTGYYNETFWAFVAIQNKLFR